MELSFPVFCISRETVNFPFQSCFIQINFLQLCLIALQFFIHCFRVNLNANPFFNGLGIFLIPYDLTNCLNDHRFNIGLFQHRLIFTMLTPEPSYSDYIHNSKFLCKCHLYLSMRVYSYTWDFHKPGISADLITNELDPAQFLTVALLRF